MTNLAVEKQYDNARDMIMFAMTQFMKGLWTACPGIVDSYNGSSKRAVIRPALDLVRTDGARIAHPLINDVPVLHPSGGGFTMLVPLVQGDAVMLLFSQRGMAQFKLSYAQSEPDAEGFLSLKDAVAIAGFGALSIIPATTNGATMQSEDGANYIYVKNGEVKVKTPGNVTVEAGGDVTVDAGNVTVEASGNVAVNAGGGCTITATNGSTFQGNLQINGDLDMTGDLNLGSLNVNNHVHVETGTITNGPQN